MFKVTIGINSSIVVDEMQLLMDCQVKTARKIFKLERTYSGNLERIENGMQIENAFELATELYKAGQCKPQIYKKAEKIHDLYFSEKL